MPRSPRPAATVAMNGWAIPAPAPWANTKHALARVGLIRSAETEPELPVSNVSCCVLKVVIARTSLPKIGLNGKRRRGHATGQGGRKPAEEPHAARARTEFRRVEFSGARHRMFRNI